MGIALEISLMSEFFTPPKRRPSTGT